MLSKEQVVARASHAAFGKPLVTNVHRSMLVEAMVAEILEPTWTWCAADYSSYDFHDASGIRLEVKQSAAMQTWNAGIGRASKSSFDIAPRTGEYVDGVVWREGTARNAVIYLFAHHPVADLTADHRDPAQWLFYVVLESALPAQNSIALSGVSKLTQPVVISDLCEKVAQLVNEFRE